jgi:hypothetical protein
MNNQKGESNTQLAKKPASRNQKEGIENHIKAARHFEEAAKKHQDAAAYLEQGKLEQAEQSTITAIGHTSLGKGAQVQSTNAVS